MLVGEVNMGMGDEAGEDKEWVCDTGANYHMCGDDSLFDTLEDIPSTFHVKKIKGKVAVSQWGVVRLSTDRGNGKWGMRVNIFSLQRIRSKGSCSYAFARNPQPGKKIPIYNKVGEKIATILENEKARPTLVCEKYHGAAQLEGEVLGGKGITMELLHRRLGHTSQGGLERLVREQLVRG